MGTARADHLLAEHAPALRNFLGARCRDDDLAAELLQEVASRLVVAAPRLQANGNQRAYLFRIAASVWHDHLRRELVRRRAARIAEVAEPGRAPAADERLLERELREAVRRELVRRRALDEMRDDERTPPPASDEGVLERDLSTAVRRAVDTLPAAQREVVTLRHGAGLTFREIAERLGRPLGTVLTQMRAALEKIGVALEAYR